MMPKVEPDRLQLVGVYGVGKNGSRYDETVPRNGQQDNG